MTAAIRVDIRRGAYYDSIVLMELQAALMSLPGVTGAGVMMGTPANKALLDQNGLSTPDTQAALPEDLIISIEGQDEAAAESALAQVDALLTRRRTAIEQDYRPKSLATAAQHLPEAAWVLVSVPGRYATSVAREALRLNKNVFLYSDNVSLDDEIALKQESAARGLLVMGPDCGTAIIGGVGLGFANRVRRGPIGLVGASGTGLQHVTARIHQFDSGITHALGTGGRDLAHAVGGITARQALDLLRRDSETRVIVLLSKPPARDVAATVMRQARDAGKPVVIYFTGYAPPAGSTGESHLHVATSLDEAAERAVALAASADGISSPEPPSHAFAPSQRYVRGLFSGGTLAHETLLTLQAYLPAVYSNVALDEEHKLTDPTVSQGHTILDLGADEFTVDRPHPMLDNSLRLQRLSQEADDPTVAMILLDVVLGYGAHPDPAAELAPAIAETRAKAQEAGRAVDLVVLVVGTDEDPQDMAAQIEQFEAAGARVETRCSAAAAYVGQRLQDLEAPSPLPSVDLAVLNQPLQALNVGLEAFAASLTAQDAPVIHVDWRPPAGGNEKLMSILERMRKR
ncbi:MAG: acyl-CoA synthetase FdrA [Kiloniellales bacterium]